MLIFTLQLWRSACVNRSQSAFDIWTLEFFLILLYKTAPALWSCMGIMSEQPFMPSLIFSFGLMCGLWLGHFRTLTMLFWKHLFVAFVCSFGCMLGIIVSLSDLNSGFFFATLQKALTGEKLGQQSLYAQSLLTQLRKLVTPSEASQLSWWPPSLAPCLPGHSGQPALGKFMHNNGFNWLGNSLVSISWLVRFSTLFSKLRGVFFCLHGEVFGQVSDSPVIGAPKYNIYTPIT